ncbi:RINT-1/TIP-20 [Cladochytrium replicatum]|nr:RINT-1/TIP-20 [Cladochytrium replicatum]
MLKIYAHVSTSLFPSHPDQPYSEQWALDSLPGGHDLRVWLESTTLAITRRLHLSVQSRLSQNLEKALDNIGWPKPSESSEKIEEVQLTLGDLFRLKSPTTELGVDQAFRVLVSAVSKAFSFHFDGERETHRVDKPEWLFAYLSRAIESTTPFLHTKIQPVLTTTSPHLALHLFIHHLLESTAIPHLTSNLQTYLSRPTLLSHLLTHLSRFQDDLRTDSAYPPQSTLTFKWRRCIDVFLDPETFEIWMEIEARVAGKRVEESLGSEKAWELAYAVGLDDSKRTNSAQAVIGLLESIRQRIGMVPTLAHSLVILRTIAISKVLRPYLDAVLDRLRNHEHTFAGVRSADDWKTQRTRVCAYVSSLLCVSHTLRTWSDEDDVYIEMGRAIKGEEGDSAGIWDSVCNAYERGCERVGFRILVDDAVQEFLEEVWPYEKKRSWQTDGSVSAELAPALSILRSTLGTIETHLGPPPFRARLVRIFAEKIDSVLYDRVFLRSEPDDESRLKRSRAVRVDLNALWGCWSHESKNPAGMFKRCRDGARVLEVLMEEEGTDVESTRAVLGQVLEIAAEKRQGKRKLGRSVEREREMLEGVGVYTLTVDEVVTLVQCWV